MKLADLRKLSIKRQIRIRFQLQNGMDCVVTETGIAQVPGLRAIPDFNLEAELASARQFTFEPVDNRGAKNSPGSGSAAGPRVLTREALAELIAAAAPGAALHADHEDE